MAKTLLPSGLYSKFDLKEDGWNDEVNSNFELTGSTHIPCVENMLGTASLPTIATDGDAYVDTDTSEIAIWYCNKFNRFPLPCGWTYLNKNDSTFYYLDETGTISMLATGGGGASLLKFADLASFPATGSNTAIYLAEDTDKLYHWDGSQYVEASPNDVFQQSGVEITPVSGTTLDMGTTGTIQAKNIENSPGDNLLISSNEPSTGTIVMHANGSVSIAIDADNDTTNSAFRVGKDTTNATAFPLLTVQESGNVLFYDDTGVNILTIVDSFVTIPFSSNQGAGGVNVQGQPAFFQNQGANLDLAIRSTDDIEISYDTDNDSGGSQLIIGYNGTGVGHTRQATFTEGNIDFQDPLDMNDEDVTGLNLLAATTNENLRFEGNSDGFSGEPSFTFKEVNAGGGGSTNNIFNIERSDGVNIVEIQRNGDITLVDDASIAPISGAAGIKFAFNEIEMTGGTVAVLSSGGGSIFDVQRQIQNTSTNFDGNVAIRDDIRMLKASAGFEGDKIETTGTNVLGRGGIIFDNVGADAATALTVNGTFLARYRNLGANKFAIAQNGGVSEGILLVNADAGSDGAAVIGVDASGGPVTITLQTSDRPIPGRRIKVCKTNNSTNIVTVVDQGGQPIEGNIAGIQLTVGWASAEFIWMDTGIGWVVFGN